MGSFYVNGEVSKETLQSIVRCWTLCESNADYAFAVRISRKYHIVDGCNVQAELVNGLSNDIEFYNANYMRNIPEERMDLITTLALFKPIEEAFQLVDGVDRSTEIKFDSIWDEVGLVLLQPHLAARE